MKWAVLSCYTGVTKTKTKKNGERPYKFLVRVHKWKVHDHGIWEIFEEVVFLEGRG